MNAILNSFLLYSPFKLGIGIHRQQYYLHFDYWDISEDSGIHCLSICIISEKIGSFDLQKSACSLLWCLICCCHLIFIEFSKKLKHLKRGMKLWYNLPCLSFYIWRQVRPLQPFVLVKTRGAEVSFKLHIPNTWRQPIV